MLASCGFYYDVVSSFWHSHQLIKLRRHEIHKLGHFQRKQRLKNAERHSSGHFFCQIILYLFGVDQTTGTFAFVLWIGSANGSQHKNPTLKLAALKNIKFVLNKKQNAHSIKSCEVRRLHNRTIRNSFWGNKESMNQRTQLNQSVNQSISIPGHATVSWSGSNHGHGRGFCWPALFQGNRK